MPSMREMRLRIRSIKNLSQVTKALETVSASKVRKAIQAVVATEPYAKKAWEVLVHLAEQPGHSNLHPLLRERKSVEKVLVVMVSGDRGLAGAYNINILRQTLRAMDEIPAQIDFLPVGRKGRDLLVRSGHRIVADFSNLPTPITFMNVSAIGRMVVGEFADGHYDQIYLAYTQYINMIRQQPIVRKLLPLSVEESGKAGTIAGETIEHLPGNAVFTYEPDSSELLNEIVPRFIGLQIYQAVLSSKASEEASRMIAMRNASDNARELMGALQLEYNKLRQQVITNDILDIAAGAEAQSQRR